MRSVACLFLLVLVVYGGYRSVWFEENYRFPFPYRPLVETYAASRELDPMLVAAVIQAESKFKPQAVSNQGARGLMQMMPETAQWVAHNIGEDAFFEEHLNEPETNIRFGTWYLASLKQEFQGNEVLMLAAYNGGRGTVRQWMRTYGWNFSFQDVKAIPYGETREYVERVLSGRERYRQLYGNKG
nr:lytic transglycosylase domain-containing protein [uncultured Anaeromusa sp.]